MILPRFRQELQVTKLADELLVFDPKENKAHCFNLVGSVVFQACQEKISEAELLAKLSQLKDVVDAQESLDEALASFAELGLLSTSPSGLGRREFLSTGGKAMAGVLVASALAPMPAAAASSDTCRCGADFAPLVLHSQTYHKSANSPTQPALGKFVNREICVGASEGAPPANYKFVWIEPVGATELIFDETVTFSVTPVGEGSTVTGCFSSFQATSCGNCTPLSANQGQPIALDITRFFPKDGFGNVLCGRYLIEAWHCNGQGAAQVTAFRINYGSFHPGGSVL